jgi:malate dehydrogenase (quinone)
VAALLGASPGASTAVAVMLGILPRCFKKQSQSETWQNKLKEMAPSFGVPLSKNEKLLDDSRQRTTAILGLARSYHA